jgi:hypothetical protein
MLRKDLYPISLLSGSFCIGYNGAMAFHELGHAFAMKLDEGQIKEFVLKLISWN